MEIQMSSPPKRTKSLTKSSSRRALESTVAQFDELLAAAELKEGKRGDVLIAKANALKELLALEADDRETETQDTITRLEDQHATDTRCIAELETTNAALRAKPAEVIREKDPEAAAIRYQNATLIEAFKFAASSVPESERPSAAIQAIKTLSPKAAREFCEVVGISYKEYCQIICWSDMELQDTVTRAQVRGPAAVCAAAL